MELTFINGGNRPMGVVAVDLIAVQPQPGIDFKDCQGAGAFGKADFKPFVVKGGEVDVRGFKFTQDSPLKIVELNMAKQIRSVMLCLSFGVATPGRFRGDLRKPLLQVNHETGKQEWQYEVLYKSTRPISLIERQSTIFGEKDDAASNR